MFKKTSTLALVFSVMTSFAAASTVVQFYEPYSGGIVDNLANSAGTPTNGMSWGIVVDTTGNGFSLGGNMYDAYVGGVATAGFFSAAGALTDDYFIPGSGTTVDASGLFAGGDGGDTPGNGSIVTDLTVDYTNGVSTGDSFRLVWFESNTATGSKYGLFGDASFTMVSDQGGNAIGYTAPFEGNDPIRTASNTFQAVPEPSRVLFLALGGMGLLMRRRRD